MPACITHNLFAKNVLKALPERPESLDETAYLWGAQGPDFLFCHRYMPWMKGESLGAYGSKVHATTPSHTLNLMRDFLKTHSDPGYRSYVMGFLCHYALDSTGHPYINARSEEWAPLNPNQTPGTMHGEIESALDAIVLRRETGKLPSEVPLKNMFPKNPGVQRQIAEIYQVVLKGLFDLDAQLKDLYQASQDAHTVFSCVTDRTGLKLKLMEKIESGKPHAISSHIVPLTEKADVDYANIQHEPWTVEGETRKEDFFELMELAQTKAVNFITAFDSADLSALTAEKPFG